MAGSEKAGMATFNPLDLINIFVDLFKIGREASKEAREERREIYEKVFSPQFELLRNAHEHYMTSFSAFVEKCRKQETPNVELVRLIREYSLKNRHMRQDALAFSATVHTLAKRFRNPAQTDAVRSFADAIEKYFDATWLDNDKHERGQTWFTVVLGKMEELSGRGLSPWDYNYEGVIASPHPVRTFVAGVQDIYSEILPKRWQAVAEAKDKVRAAFFVG
jgi:hypothetical protein